MKRPSLDTIGAVLDQVECSHKDQAIRILEEMPSSRDKRRSSSRQCPDGCITLMGAYRKYGIPPSTLAGRIKKGEISYKHKTAREKYLKESELIILLKNYIPGRGKWKRKKTEDN